MDNELNLFDLFLLAWRGCKRAVKALWRTFMCAMHLTIRKWWISLPVLAIFIAGALIFTRKDNLTYKVYAVAKLNGPTLNLFNEVFRPLQSGVFFNEPPEVAQYIYNHTARRFETFPVIDCLRDNIIDYVDFDRDVKPTDTVNWQMRDHICIQFRAKYRDLGQVPTIERELLSYFNGNESMQHAYRAALPVMERKVQFCHTQIEKLDSLTSSFYFNNKELSLQESSNNTIITGEQSARSMELFLPAIYEHIDYTQKVDVQRSTYTAPIALESHFAVNPDPVNSRAKMLVIFILAGWIVSLAIAWGVEKRETSRKEVLRAVHGAK